MNKTRLIFRADGNSLIGLGHVIRSLALAEIVEPAFSCDFVIQNPSDQLEKQVKEICPSVIKLPESTTETELLQEAAGLVNELTGNEIIVLDGYKFSSEYQKILKLKGSILVCIDDLFENYFRADVVINVAGGLIPDIYRTASYTKIYLGPKYAMLRKPFREVQKISRQPDRKIATLLICFGGADPENYTLKYLKVLSSSTPGLQIKVVTGSAYKHQEALRSFFTNRSTLSWYTDLSAVQLRNLMEQCSIALCSASTVAYEFCAVNGLLFIEQTAGNQKSFYNYLVHSGLALPASDIEVVLKESINSVTQKMVAKQQEVFNGKAELNLTTLFYQLDFQAKLTFRAVTANDTDLLFEWANDPVVRQFSFNKAPIPLETHISWLSCKLNEPNTLLLMAEISDRPSAFLRFEITDNIALISYQISAYFRGKGLGHQVLLKGLLRFKKKFPGVKVATGFVQSQNIASIRAFEKAGFKKTGTENFDSGAICFSKELSSLPL